MKKSSGYACDSTIFIYRGSATLDLRAITRATSHPLIMTNESEDVDASYHMSFPSMTTTAGPGTAAGDRASFSCLLSDFFRQ